MKNTLIIYFSSLFLSALFTVFAVFLGFSMEPYNSFEKEYVYILGVFFPLFHFCVSTWLFMFFPKIGSQIGVVTSIGMFISPFLTFCFGLPNLYKGRTGTDDVFKMLVYLSILMLNVYLVYLFKENFKKPELTPFEYKVGLTSISLLIVIGVIVFGWDWRY